MGSQQSKIEFGLCVMYPSPGTVERIGPDWDWIWIDGQHGALGGYQDILAMVRACQFIGRPAIVRVPGHESGPIGLALDTGAAGVIVPQVDTVDQAQRIVASAKFPPVGNRSYGGRRPIDLKGRLYSNTANTDQLLICQIESDEALGNAEALAGTEGVDGLFLGPDDMRLRRGFAMDEPKSIGMMEECLKTLVAACEKHGKFVVSVAIGEEMIALTARLGVRWIVSGADVSFLAAGSADASRTAREWSSEALANPLKDVPVEASQTKNLY